MEQQFDWLAPRASTSQVCDLLPGITDKIISIWTVRGFLDVLPVGTGSVREWTGADILQLWTLHEVNRFGMPLIVGRHLWAHVQEGLMGWPSPHEISAIVAQGDPPIIRVFREDAEDDSPHGAQLGHPKAPVACMLFRMSRMIRRAETMLSDMTPIHRPRGRQKKS